VNMPILQACAVIGVIAEVVVTVVIGREVTVRAEDVSAEAAVSIAIAAKAVVSIGVAAKVAVSIVVAAEAGAVRFGPAEAAQTRTSEPSQGAAAGMFATKSATHVATAESTARVAASESAAATSEPSAASMTAATASESSASSMTATAAAATDRPGRHGVSRDRRAECDGDQENHDLACDRLLLDAGR
jgi:hypothetical protein